MWGSSFLFTKIAVTNLPPALFSGDSLRHRGHAARADRPHSGAAAACPTRLIEWRHVIIAGFFMVFVSNGLNTWAMQYLAEQSVGAAQRHLGVLDRRPRRVRAARPSADALGGSGIGASDSSGAVLMLIPEGALEHQELCWRKLGVLTACCSWSLGTLYYRSIDTN